MQTPSHIWFELGFACGLQLACFMLAGAFYFKFRQAKRWVHEKVERMTINELEAELASRKGKNYGESKEDRS